MDPESTSPPAAPPAADPLLAPQARRRFIPGLWGCVVLVVVLAVLLVLILPFFKQSNVKGPQTKALSKAKQIALGLRLFAEDNDGNFPRAGLPDMSAAELKDSNAAFAMLFPEYLTNESLFGNELSVYQTRPPDEKIGKLSPDGPDRTLEPGENVYSYVAGLTKKSPSDSPLVADGTDGTGHYTTDAKKRGGVWNGKKAIVIRVDGTGDFETLAGPGDARYVPRQAGGGNLLDVSGLGPGVRLLDPAIDPAGRVH